MGSGASLGPETAFVHEIEALLNAGYSRGFASECRIGCLWQPTGH